MTTTSGQENIIIHHVNIRAIWLPGFVGGLVSQIKVQAKNTTHFSNAEVPTTFKQILFVTQARNGRNKTG